MKTFGPRVIVKPDCGFAGMLGIPDAYSIAFGKLENMVEAARLVAKSSISGKTP
jgi:methionine synthase II (cobalamin-independent)